MRRLADEVELVELMFPGGYRNRVAEMRAALELDPEMTTQEYARRENEAWLREHGLEPRS